MSGRATDSSPTEALAGLVERVTFHNAENGFCVLRVKVRGQRYLGSGMIRGKVSLSALDG
jgi:exodeoxyribonuclease V alpha subunit